MAPNNDDVVLDTYKEQDLIISQSETSGEQAVNFLNTLVGRESRPVDVIKPAGGIKLGDVKDPADAPHPNKTSKTLGLQKRHLDIDNFIRWMEDVHKYELEYDEFRVPESSVTVQKPKELMELLLLLRTRLEYEGAESTTRWLPDSLVELLQNS
uniref:Uncharacterized protein n=1 Tax=Peronospora matthiolae TaxID=2874970 RepID=A0AAV1TKE1_9STRA